MIKILLFLAWLFSSPNLLQVKTHLGPKTRVWEKSSSSFEVHQGKSLQAPEPRQVAEGVRYDLASGSTLAARGVPNALDISSKQFGKKLGQKARELGLDPASARDRFGLQNRIQRIFNNADEVRTNLWRGLGPGGKEGSALFFRRGNDVIVTTPEGGFVTLLQGGANNARFLSGTVVP